jgi:Rad3-related DNA helicase
MKKYIDFFKKSNLIPRQQQTEVLEILEEHWDKYKYFVLDMPVGTGKTHICLATAERLSNSYILTAEKTLQDQYQKHSSIVVDIKGRGNYLCNANTDFMVDAAPCVASKDLFNHCMSSSLCAYYNQKAKALASQALITNYAYFLYSTHCGIVSDDNPWVRRTALIMDEAHTLESYLISFAESEFKINDLHETYGIGDKEWQITDSHDSNMKLLELVFVSLEDKIDGLKEQIKELIDRGPKITKASQAKNITRAISDRVKKLNTQLYTLDKLLQPLKIFYATCDDKSKWLITPDPSENSIKLSPLTANFLFDHYLDGMAEKFVFCSATISNKKVFCKELGLNEADTCFIQVGTPFKPEKSPIHLIPVGKMGYKDLDKTIPNIVGAIEAIMGNYSGQKGVIHAGTYKITTGILNGVDRATKARLIARDMHDDQKHHNQTLIKMHEGSKTDTVLISPSMTTGIDLADDLSRFQIIVKLPWLSLADPRIKKKSEIDSEWYADKMWTEILQASGRSTRSEEDWCDTYILDGSFIFFYNQYKNHLPGWFKDRIVF